MFGKDKQNQVQRLDEVATKLKSVSTNLEQVATHMQALVQTQQENYRKIEDLRVRIHTITERLRDNMARRRTMTQSAPASGAAVRQTEKSQGAFSQPVFNRVYEFVDEKETKKFTEMARIDELEVLLMDWNKFFDKEQ